MSDKTFYVTTPIYYVNARPHIGHAYTTIVADVLARRHRLLGEDTFFLTGTDEHGQKIERSAAAAGIPPQQFADQVSKSFRDLWKRMGILRDTGDPLYQQDYIRTTDPRHIRGVQKLFSDLYKNGFIYLSTYTGAYCVSDEAFVDAPVGTPCPDCGRLLEEVTEENFFFKLSAFQLPLLDLIESNTIAITPDSRRNEVLSFLRGNVSEILTKAAIKDNAVILSEAVGGLSENAVILNEAVGGLSENAVILSEAAGGSSPDAQSKDPDALNPTSTAHPISTSKLGNLYLPGALKDLSISRSSFTWGIPVPEDVQRAAGATQKHVIYVWLDALANYMTALGYGSDDETLLKKFWPADLHLVGKEIIRFHCVYWPAFLLALNPAFNESNPDPVIPNQAQAGIEPHAIDPSQPSHNPVILSEARSAQPKDPDTASPTTTAHTFSTTNADARASTNPQRPQLTFDQHQRWAKDWLPKQITAHGWLLFDDSKMSKSKGNIVRTETILDAFGTLCPPTPATPSQNPVISTEPRESEANRGGSGEIPAFSSPHHQSVILSEAQSAQSKDPEALHPAPTTGTPSTENPAKADRDLFASDVLRYFLLREIPFGQDGSFSFDALITRYNADLANGYGNLVSRVLNMIQQYFNGVVPNHLKAKELGLMTADTFASAFGLPLAEIEDHLGACRFNQAIERISQYISGNDGNLSQRAPWKLAKIGEMDQVEAILYTAAESIRIITALLYPILPYATAKVWKQLGFEKTIEQAAADGELKNLTWGGLKPGTKLGPLGPIFPRADKGLAKIMTDMENPTNPTDMSSRPDPEQAKRVEGEAERPAGEPATTSPAAAPRTTTLPEPATTLPVAGSTALTTGAAPTTTPSPLASPSLESPQITIDDFAKIELRVAQILVAERIPKADKLLRLEVDLGPFGKRQILSGIAEWYSPEDLINRRIVVITNLAPRKMRGLESHGMLLAASHGENGKPVLATFGEDIALGSRLK